MLSVTILKVTVWQPHLYRQSSVPQIRIIYMKVQVSSARSLSHGKKSLTRQEDSHTARSLSHGKKSLAQQKSPYMASLPAVMRSEPEIRNMYYVHDKM